MAIDAARAEASPGANIGLGAFVFAVFAAVVLLLLGVRSWDVWGGVLVAPILVVLSTPALRREAGREGSSRTMTLLGAALLLKLGGGVARYFVAFTVYGGVADATRYDEWGRAIATHLWRGDLDTGLHSLSGTDFIRFLTGLVY